MVEPVFGWYGGKATMAPWIETFFPKHTVYVEMFGGSGAVLLYKQPSKVEVYNDVDGGLVNFYKVMQNEVMAMALAGRLNDSPISREFYCYCRDTWRDVLASWKKQEIGSDSEQPCIEAAYRFYIAISQAFASRTTGSTGWALGRNHNDIATWRSKVGRFPQIHQRLRMVYIENRSYDQLYSDWDSPATLFYADPPYAPSSRSEGAEKVYEYDFTEEEYVAFLASATRIQGSIIISCYSTEHDRILEEHGFTLLKKQAHDMRGNGKVEQLWMNRTGRPTLFDEDKGALR